MQKFFSTLFVVVLLLLSHSSIMAQDSETRQLGSFNGIAASASVNVEMVKGNKNQAEVSVSNVELDEVVTEVKNGILKVGMDNNRKNRRWSKKQKVNVTVTYTEDPDYISVSSSADLECQDKIRGKNLEIKVNSSGDLILSVDVEHLEASVSSSGDVEIEGTADEAIVEASSSADFLGKNLEVNDADLSASSSADIEIGVKRSLEASASSSGDIIYYGNPIVKDVHKSSSGDVTRG